MENILLLLISILLCFSTSWSLTTFLRLQSGHNTSPSTAYFTNTCNITEEYIKVGKYTSISLIILSVIIMISASVRLIKT
uniref:Uncharacterized protein n=1 Tax=viral metagenome TaxID=1070528 RepID=A0A6C0LV69_9ZZZZ